jgi:hypothetical protein
VSAGCPYDAVTDGEEACVGVPAADPAAVTSRARAAAVCRTGAYSERIALKAPVIWLNSSSGRASSRATRTRSSGVSSSSATSTATRGGEALAALHAGQLQLGGALFTDGEHQHVRGGGAGQYQQVAHVEQVGGPRRGRHDRRGGLRAPTAVSVATARMGAATR